MTDYLKLKQKQEAKLVQQLEDNLVAYANMIPGDQGGWDKIPRLAQMVLEARKIDWNRKWIKVSEKLPSEDPKCGQVKVIFCSLDWSWPIVGLFTNFGDSVEWSAYDQQNDRYEIWEPAPTLWMLMPEVPKLK